jgi:hypothetical protein
MQLWGGCGPSTAHGFFFFDIDYPINIPENSINFQIS